MDDTTPSEARSSYGGHREFNAARRAASDRLRALARQAAEELEELELAQGMRERRRRPRDRKRFLLAVEALLSDALLEAVSKGDSARLRVSLDKNRMFGREAYGGWRDGAPRIGEQLGHALKALSAPAENPWLLMELGGLGMPGDRGRQTEFAPGPRLLAAMVETPLWASDTGLDYSHEELVRLRAAPRRARRSDEEPRKGRPLPYDDTADTLRMRDEMRRINARLSELTVELADEDGVFETLPSPTLVRRFTHGSFANGGRLWMPYGEPPWYRLPNKETAERENRSSRLERLMIDGEPVAAVDVKSCAAAVLYARAGHPLPDFDPYLPPGFPPEHRTAMKKLFAACVNYEGRMQAWPTKVPKKVRPCGGRKAVAALEEWNAPIVHLMSSSTAGHEAMRAESDMIVRALLSAPHLKALPLHDSLLVRQDQADDASEVLHAAFREVTGGDCRVGVEFP